MKVLVACEESQAVTRELRILGHEAYSCDLLKCSGGHPEWHFNSDVFEIINNKGGLLQNGSMAYVDAWDLMIAHPPCTFLASSGAKWYYHPDDKHLPKEERRSHPRFPNRAMDRAAALDFVKRLYDAPIKKIAIENPIGILSTHLKKPDQIVQPWMFGDSANKTTCLWLKGLSPLKPTEIVEPGEKYYLKNGKTMPLWYVEALQKAKTPEQRRNLRSKTFLGMAKAMAKQWTELQNIEEPKLCELDFS